jgi:mono/diheme cytochrome c family protein
LWLLVRRYSYLASFSVFLLIVTGLFNGLVELPNLASLIETAYGRVLLIKLLLVALALGTAFFNNRLVHHDANRQHSAAELQRFNRQVGLEAIVSLVLMLSVAVLVQTQPPGSLAAQEGSAEAALPFNTILEAGDLYVHVQVTPNQAGNNRFWVHLYHADGSPIGEVQLVRMLFNYRDAELGQANADLNPLGRDTFALEGAYLNQAGAWELSVYVRRRGMDDVLTDFRLEVPPPAQATIRVDPLQNPLPALPIDGLLAGALIVLGVIPLFWRRPLEQARPELFPAITLIGVVFVVVGLVTGANSAAVLVSRFTAREGMPASVNPIPPTADSIEQGRLLYQQHCSSCHGPSGGGDGPLAGSLDPPPANLRVHLVPGIHTDAQIFDWITNGFPNSAMPAFDDTLAEQERWHVVNFIRTFASEE